MDPKPTGRFFASRSSSTPRSRLPRSWFTIALLAAVNILLTAAVLSPLCSRRYRAPLAAAKRKRCVRLLARLSGGSREERCVRRLWRIVGSVFGCVAARAGHGIVHMCSSCVTHMTNENTVAFSSDLEPSQMFS